jgi:hypothetical protein
MTDQNWKMADDIAKLLSENGKWLSHVGSWTHGVSRLGWCASAQSGRGLDQGRGSTCGQKQRVAGTKMSVIS